MRNLLTLLLLLIVLGCNAFPQPSDDNKLLNSNTDGNNPSHNTSVLSKKQWAHGAENCDGNQDPILDIYQHTLDTFIIRQNKCLTYEAPFIYILIGKERILVIDTGAIEKAEEFSLHAQIKSAIGLMHQDKKWLVIHTHSHRDHTAGDQAFSAQSKVKLVGTKATDIQEFFGFQSWPNEIAHVELGERKVTIIPTPGHQEEAISIYDPTTQWLLTGDSLYPGKIYIKNWQAYNTSIRRLLDFSNQHVIKAILGAHIEMTNQPGRDYPIGTQYQPNEHPLDLSVSDLHKLNFTLEKYQEEAPDNALVFDNFIVEPMGFFQRTMSDIFRFFNT
ncbi:MBL fold metallo-hydrolase [uncultured Shewanella sp.]|uniref:MBL fold metallo-hydrolase n=1 Tax=uncultured Shewanella sp. TaxID=173975 RepID=UPI002632E10D|nr:MBL fold metallo-hydrolase [uncultured Shewanella sp.]